MEFIHICDICNYKTCKLYNWNKHIETSKHRNKIEKKKYICIICNKSYKFKSGLSRHKCKKLELIKVEKDEPKITSDMFYEVLNQNNKLQEKLLELSNKPSIINVDNKKTTINIFLNETCKNAMNMSEFINNVDISLDDLTYTTDNGYIKGISNIFFKNLEVMKPSERPFHCSDKKRLQFYVKEEDKWGERQ
jgi:hypothetical protein